MTVDELIVAARGWLGVPFHHQGRSRNGVDCVGLPLCILSENHSLPEGLDVRAEYGRRPNGQLSLELQKWCTRIPFVRKGCLITIKWPNEKDVSHVAICLGDTLIHSAARLGCVTEQKHRGALLKWSRGYWLMPGIAYE